MTTRRAQLARLAIVAAIATTAMIAAAVNLDTSRTQTAQMQGKNR